MIRKGFDLNAFMERNGLNTVSLTSFDAEEINAARRYMLRGMPFQWMYGIDVLKRHRENEVWKDLDDPNGGHYYVKNDNGNWIRHNGKEEDEEQGQGE